MIVIIICPHLTAKNTLSLCIWLTWFERLHCRSNFVTQWGHFKIFSLYINVKLIENIKICQTKNLTCLTFSSRCELSMCLSNIAQLGHSNRHCSQVNVLNIAWALCMWIVRSIELAITFWLYLYLKSLSNSEFTGIIARWSSSSFTSFLCKGSKGE